MAVSCSVKAQEGLLYPLKQSLVFVQKPIIYIKHKEISYVEFMRIGTHGTTTGKSFDISLVRCDSVGSETFKNIDKFELKVLVSYFKRSGIKMR